MFLNLDEIWVDGLRSKICSKFGVLPHDQELKYLNTELTNGKLSFYEIKPEAVIEVRRRKISEKSQKKIPMIYVTPLSPSVKFTDGRELPMCLEFDSSKTIKQLKYEMQESHGNCLYK